MAEPSLRRNVSSLVVVQLANYAVPLLVLPHLLRALGPEGFGRAAFVLAVVQYLVIITDFGFNLSATRQIASYRSEPQSLARIFWSTTAAKALLAVACIALASITIYAVPQLRPLLPFFLLGCVSVVGAVAVPAWWFQGCERLQTFATLQLISRLCCAALILILVRDSSDVGLTVLLQSAAPMLAGVFGCYFLNVPKLEKSISMQDVVSQARSGWQMFLATSSVSLYTTSNVFILGLVASPSAVGYFSFGERVVRACAGLITPLVQAVFPRLSLMRKRGAVMSGLYKRTLLLLIFISLTCGAVLAIFPKLVASLLGGAEFTAAASVLLLLSGMPALLALSSYLGTLRMAILGLDSQLSIILFSAGVANILGVAVLGSVIMEDGAAISVIVTEIIIVALMVLALRRNADSVLGLSRLDERT